MRNSKAMIILALLLMSLSLKSQDLKLAEVALPAPKVFSLKYFKSLGERHIFYGKKPLKPNGKVILFVPGYLEEADFLLLGNCFYKYAYDEGYQTAFVSMTRGQGDWVNGEILQRAIKQVKDHYKVNKIDLVAHSNGGKASEVALFHYGKIADINKVVSLGTPFRGTQAADVAAIAGMSWILEILGLDAGRAYSTTYYCDTQWRPYFDGIETAAQKKQYYNYGSWGYLHGKEILFSGAMAATGAIITLSGGGANDGVTPFYSSSIPGGNQLYKLYASEGKMDHMDMVYGQHTWKNFRKVLNGTYVPVIQKSATLSTSDNSDYSISSNYQFLSDADYFGDLQKDKGSTQLKITLLKEDENGSFDLVDKGTAAATPFKSESENLSRSVGTESPDKNKNIEELTLSFSNTKLRGASTTEDNEQYRIVGNSKYLAIAEQDVESPMNYTFKNTDTKTNLEINFPNLDKELLDKVVVTGHLFYLGSLDGVLTTTEDKQAITFVRNGNKFTYDASILKDGVYSVSITGNVEGVYKRDLISGFTVGSLASNLRSANADIANQQISDEANSKITVYPNPTTDVLNVSVNESALYTISDLQGRTVVSGKLVSGHNVIDIQNLGKGVFLLNVNNNTINESSKFVVK